MYFYSVATKFPVLKDYFLILIILIITLLIICLWKSWNTTKHYEDISTCPTVYHIVFKIFYEYLTNKEKSKDIATIVFQKLDDACKEYENEGMVCFWVFRRVLVIFGEEAMKTFTTSEESADKAIDYVGLKPVVGEGLLTSNGATQRRDRKILNPVFNETMLKNTILILNKNANIYMKKIEKVVHKSHIDILPYLNYCMFLNICEILFNSNVTEKYNEMDVDNFFKVYDKVTEYFMSMAVFPVEIRKLLTICTPLGWRHTRNMKELTHFLEQAFATVKESFTYNSCEKEEDSWEHRKSVAHILFEQQNKNSAFTSDLLQSHFNTFVIGGIDNVSNTMLWCLFLLGLHKDVQQKAYEEIQSVSEEFLTYDDLRQLTYLECVIKETLRLYPAGLVGRHLRKDLHCGKYKVPKDTTILFLINRLHRNSKIYPDPEKFDPARFYPGNAEIRKWAYLPFSAGKRNCIGKKLAMLEMKITLAYTLRNYEITSLDGRDDVGVKWKVILMPSKQIRLRLTPRKILPDTE